MNNRYDAIIIGAGYFGASISYHLSEAGYRTLLLEQKEIAGASSGANYGCIQVQDSNMGPSLRRTMRGFKTAMRLEEKLSCNLDLREMGSLITAENSAEMHELQKLYQEKKDYGLPVKWLEPADIKKIEPNIDTGTILGASYMLQARLTPWKLVYGFINKGREQGLEVREWSKVSNFMEDGDKVTGVVLEDGEKIEARHVVITAGAWTKKLGEMAGVDLPVEYIKGEAFVTESVEPHMFNYISSAGFFTDAHGGGSHSTLAMLQTGEGNFLIGETAGKGPEDPDDLNFHPSHTHLADMGRTASRFYPYLRNLKIIRTFSVASPFTENFEPLLGATRRPGLYVASGFKSCVVIADVVGEEMTDILKETDR